MEVPTLVLLRLLLLAAIVEARAPHPETEAVKEVLSKALGLHPSWVPEEVEAPSYMKRLYRAITTREGVVTAAPPYRANRVTALPPFQGSTEAFTGSVTYNVNRALLGDVQGAELHVHVPDTRPRHRLGEGRYCKHHRRHHHHHHGTEGGNSFWRRNFTHSGRRAYDTYSENSELLQIRVWARLPNGKNFFLSEGETTSGSWHVIPLETLRFVGVLDATAAIDTRVDDPSTFQLSLVVEAVTAPHLKLKPLLVLFSGRIQVPLLQVSSEWIYEAVRDDDGDTYDVVTSPSRRERRRRRDARDASLTANSTTVECVRLNMQVDFNAIGWSDWIFSPSNYNAYHCQGICTFPLGQNQHPSNHATVQSIVAYLGLIESVEQPNCGPSELESLGMLYYDSGSIVYRAYEGMVAASCGCL